MSAFGYPPGMQRQRRLRVQATEVERRLWQQLRARQLAGAKFRRQQRIGRYVVDFVCFDFRLVIELDGGQHAFKHAKDARRTADLEASGYRVLRFWNNEVVDNLDGVLERIVIALSKRSSGTR